MADKDTITQNAYELIGYVGNIIVRDRLTVSKDENGFMVRLDNLDDLTLESIVNAVYKSNGVSENADINILIPIDLHSNINIPDECKSNENSAGIRNLNKEDQRPTLTATYETCLSDTMGNINSISRDDLKKAEIDLWLSGCRDICKLDLITNEEKILSAALRSLLVSKSDLSLNDFANFCSGICFAIENKKLNIKRAVGSALPRIRLPKDLEYFSSGNLGKSKRNWIKYFNKLKDRERIYTRQEANGAIIKRESLIENLRQCIENGVVFKDDAIRAIRAYIDADDNDYSKSEELFEFDWELDNIKKIFAPVKEKEIGLGEATKIYFKSNFLATEVNQITEEEEAFLDTINDIKIGKEELPKLSNFFALHKSDLAQNPHLYSRWEAQVFKNKNEYTDFYEGFLELLTNTISSKIDENKSYSIAVTIDGTLSSFLDKNYNALRFFSLMYKPLISKLNDSGIIKWKHAFFNDVEIDLPIIDYVKFFEAQRTRKVSEKLV